MTGLGELFTDLVEVPAPPSRLTAADAYLAGRRRRRRRVAGWTGAATFLAAIAATLGLIALAPGGRGKGGVDPAGGTPSPVAITALNQWVGAADARHLYVAVNACPDHSCPKGTVRVVASADGGRSWSAPGDPVFVELSVVGPGTLLGTTVPVAGAGRRTPLISTDSGRTWTAVEQATAPLPAVPAGGVAACRTETDQATCRLYAVDPATVRMAPLANQPDLLLNAGTEFVEPNPGAAGALWVAGSDLRTRRPAVAVSVDAGRTWSTHVFADLPACRTAVCDKPRLTIDASGRTVYAELIGPDAKTRRLYRGGAGSDWQRVAGAEAVPVDRYGVGTAFVAADGTYVTGQLVTPSRGQGQTEVRFWAARGTGQPFVPVALAGLPASALSVRLAPDGWLYALSYTDGAVYGSTDGWHWSPVTTH